MILAWVALGAAALWALLRLGRHTDRTSRVQWRVATTIFAAACWGGAALAAIRGSWIIAAILLGTALWLTLASRQRDARPAPRNGLSEAEARRILGVSSNADETEVRAAYRRLMARAHPDAGGSQGLAEQLNAARDRLLKT